MRKFLIAICGILVATGALGAKSQKSPNPVTDAIKQSWGWGGNYNQSVAGEFMDADYLNQRHGACGRDEGAGVAIIAHKIWEHGGYFCTTQIQSANAGGKSWIDFYKRTDNIYKCETICMPGYYGTKCEKTGVGDCNDGANKDYTSDLDNVIDNSKLDKTDGCETGVITSDIDVFRYVSNSNNNRHSNVHVLGVIERKEHGVIVGIIQVNANRRSNHYSYIADVYSDGQTKLLCAEGYVANSNKTDCIPGPLCATDEDKLNNMCPGFSGYDSSQHSLKHDAAKSCYYFRCKNNKGFQSELSRTCIECEGGLLAYVNNDGLCDVCIKGEYPRSSGNGCIPKEQMDTYSQTQMKSGPNGGRDCWLETDPEKFGGCVICSSNNQCWDGGSCTSCD